MKEGCGVNVSRQQERTNQSVKTTLPKDLQIQMLKFFLKTSVPRKKREQMERERAQQEQVKCAKVESGQAQQEQLKLEQTQTISLSSETKSDGSEKK